MQRLSLLGALAALCVAAGTPAHAQTPMALPQGDGRDLVAVACSQCHTLNTILVGREGTAGWKRHVYNMVLRGAQLSPREADTVIQYLTANFGPGTPQPAAAKSVALPGGAGKELVEARCSTCHDLERVTIVKRQKRDWPFIVGNMVTRGAIATPEEAQQIAAYLVAQFGSD
jgi:mono/diheme cytochrome c family protein